MSGQLHASAAFPRGRENGKIWLSRITSAARLPLDITQTGLVLTSRDNANDVVFVLLRHGAMREMIFFFALFSCCGIHEHVVTTFDVKLVFSAV
jgi:hypothetical protein